MSKQKRPSDEILTHLYMTEKLTGTKIAELSECSKGVICKRLKKLGLTRNQKGENHSQWKGGRGIKSGYWTVYNPTHHRVLNNGRVYEHILVAEKKYGRKIKKNEPIHHIDFDRLNNDPDNLYLCKNHKEHRDLHCSLEEIARDLFRNKKLKFENGKYKA